MKLPEIKNLVAKHAQRSGAGRHDDKTGGKRSPRHKQKRKWKREVRELTS